MSVEEPIVTMLAREGFAGAGILHLYAQYGNHEEAWVVGNRAALTRLRDTLTRVLESGEPQGLTTFARDGEGYKTLVVLQEPMDGMKLPYTSLANEESPGEHPWSMMEDGVYRRLMRDKST